MKAYAKITYYWTDGGDSSWYVGSDVALRLRASDDDVRVGDQKLKEVVVQPYTNHSDSWLLYIDFDNDGGRFDTEIRITTSEQDCRVDHDPNSDPKTDYTCKPLRGETGWTLRVKTKKKTAPPSPFDALQATASATKSSAEAAEAAALAALAAVRTLRAIKDI